MTANHLVMIAIAALLGGCADSQLGLRSLENGGNLRIEPLAGGDYQVRIRNVVDFGYDPDVKADRDRIALAALQTQCPAARVIGEDRIATGAWATGRPSIEYLVRLRCR
jgi:hypothetical protein